MGKILSCTRITISSTSLNKYIFTSSQRVLKNVNNGYGRGRSPEGLRCEETHNLYLKYFIHKSKPSRVRSKVLQSKTQAIS